MSAHTPGPWTPYVLEMPLQDVPAYVSKCIAASRGDSFFFVSAEHPDGGAVDVCHVGNGPTREANARLIAAAPELLAIAEDFSIIGPDGDGLVWLVLHSSGTGRKAMFRLGEARRLAVEVAREFEECRRAAIAKARGAA